MNGRVFIDIKQNNNKPNKNLINLNSSKSLIKSEKEQQKIIYNLLYSVKETESLANSTHSIRNEQKGSPKIKQNISFLKESMSPMINSNTPKKSSFKASISTSEIVRKPDVNLGDIFKKEENFNFVKSGSLRSNEIDSVYLKQNPSFQEQPQSSLSSHYYSTQKSSFKSGKR